MLLNSYHPACCLLIAARRWLQLRFLCEVLHWQTFSCPSYALDLHLTTVMRDPELCSPKFLSQVFCRTSCLHDELLLNLVHVKRTSGDCGIDSIFRSEVFLSGNSCQTWVAYPSSRLVCFGLHLSSFGSFVLVFVDSSLDIFFVSFLFPQELFQSDRISDVLKVPSTSPDLVVPHRSGKISSELSYRGILHYVAARYLWKAPSDVMFSAVTQVTFVLL